MRDYWQNIWVEKSDAIDWDLTRPQPEVLNHKMPEAIVTAKTGIEAVDRAIREFYETGYIHNHMRLYIAS